MDYSFLSSTEETLEHFDVEEHQGLSAHQVQEATEKYGRNGTVHRHAQKLQRVLLTRPQ